MALTTPFVGDGYPIMNTPVGYQIRRKRFDLSYVATADKVANAVIPVLPVNQGEQVIDILCKVISPTTTATPDNFTLGDGDDPNGYITAIDSDATANTIVVADGALLFTTTGTTPSVTAKGTATMFKTYTANDTIDLVQPAANVPQNGIYEFVMIYREVFPA